MLTYYYLAENNQRDAVSGTDYQNEDYKNDRTRNDRRDTNT